MLTKPSNPRSSNFNLITLFIVLVTCITLMLGCGSQSSSHQSLNQPEVLYLADTYMAPFQFSVEATPIEQQSIAPSSSSPQISDPGTATEPEQPAQEETPTVAYSSAEVPQYTPQPSPFSNYSGKCSEWYALAVSVGWGEDDLPMLGSIMYAETGGTCIPNLISPTEDYGLTQINWAAHGARLSANGISPDDLLDPGINLREALVIANRSGSCKWGPWYSSGNWC